MINRKFLWAAGASLSVSLLAGCGRPIAQAELTAPEATAPLAPKQNTEQKAVRSKIEYSSSYEVTASEERGDRATVEVEGTQHYDGPSEDIADERDFTAVFDLRLVDDEWLVSNIVWTYADE